jgi:hypothetical protein
MINDLKNLTLEPKLLQEIVWSLTTTNDDLKTKNKSSYWPLNTGIFLTGLVGKFFDDLSAGNLIRRAKMWPNNEQRAVESLKMIYLSLTSISIQDRDEDYKNAVIVYNKTIMSFSEYDLEKLADSFIAI